MGEEEGGVGEVTAVGERTKVEELADGIIVAVEAVGDEDAVNGFEFLHAGTSSNDGHAPFPGSNAALGTGGINCSAVAMCVYQMVHPISNTESCGVSLTRPDWKADSSFFSFFRNL